MTITLPPDLESTLTQQAQERGITLEQAIIEGLRKVTPTPVAGNPRAPWEPRDEWEALLFSAGVETGVTNTDAIATRDNYYD